MNEYNYISYIYINWFKHLRYVSLYVHYMSETRRIFKRASARISPGEFEADTKVMQVHEYLVSILRKDLFNVERNPMKNSNAIIDAHDIWC